MRRRDSGQSYLYPAVDSRRLPSTHICRNGFVAKARGPICQGDSVTQNRPATARFALSGSGGRRPLVFQRGRAPCTWPRRRRIEAIGDSGRRCRCRPSPYLNNIIEQDHRFIRSASWRVLVFGRRKGRGERSQVTRPRATSWVSANSSILCSASPPESGNYPTAVAESLNLLFHLQQIRISLSMGYSSASRTSSP